MSVAAARAPERRTVTLVLPIFNEEPNLERLFGRIDASLHPESLVYRIIAVDDCSTDGTREMLEAFRSRAPLQVIRHSLNQGLGGAIRSGFLEAMRLSSEDDIIVTMDADDSHSPSLIASMIDHIQRGFDVVVASRFQKGSECHGVPLHRRMLSSAASVLFRVLFPTPGVRDFTCGYRAYRAGVLHRAQARFGPELFEFDGFQCMVDLLLKLRTSGARFTEVPFVLRYDQKQGHSKMQVVRTIVRTLHLLVRRSAGR